MAILSLMTGPESGAEFPLKPGVNRIGRGEGNDHVIPDGSVSSSHCEVALEGANLIVRDLGSTNGTIVQQQRVSQAVIEPGQSFRLGNVELLYRSEQPELQPTPPPEPVAPLQIPQPAIRLSGLAPVQPPVPTAPSADPIAAPCFHHPVSDAVYFCTKCRNDLCPQCVRMEKIGGKTLPFCRTCSGKCIPIDQKAATAPKKAQTFFQALPTAFSYPFKGNGLLILIAGTIFFGGLDFLTHGRRTVVILFASVLMVKVISYGYLFAYMQRIITASANGEDEPPGFPDISDMFSDVIQPFFLLLMTVLVSFGPAMVCLYNDAPLAADLALFLGMFYFPMCVLAVAMADSLSGLNPVIITSAILKVPGPYVIATILCGMLLVVYTKLPDILTAVDIPVLPQIFNWFLSLLLITIEMRVLGLLYYTNRKKIGWFE